MLVNEKNIKTVISKPLATYKLYKYLLGTYFANCKSTYNLY